MRSRQGGLCVCLLLLWVIVGGPGKGQQAFCVCLGPCHSPLLSSYAVLEWQHPNSASLRCVNLGPLSCYCRAYLQGPCLSNMKPHEAIPRHVSYRQSRSCLLLLLLAAAGLLPAPAAASRQGRQSTRIAAAAAAAAAAQDSSLNAWPRRRVHSPFNSEASMQIAARQRLFDYAVSEALDILGVAVEKVRIPEYKTKLEIPVIGGIDVAISNVNITDLQVGWGGGVLVRKLHSLGVTPPAGLQRHAPSVRALRAAPAEHFLQHEQQQQGAPRVVTRPLGVLCCAAGAA